MTESTPEPQVQDAPANAPTPISAHLTPAQRAAQRREKALAAKVAREAASKPAGAKNAKAAPEVEIDSEKMRDVLAGILLNNQAANLMISSWLEGRRVAALPGHSIKLHIPIIRITQEPAQG